MAQNIIINGASYPGVPGLSVPRSGGGSAYFMDPTELFYDNAGAHSSFFRGKYLGESVTAEQWAAIDAGTFDDMYIGDYWTLDNIDYVIACPDYWYGAGDTACATHHIAIVPRTCLITGANMNGTNTTSGAYVGSKMYTTNLDAAKTIINNAFGSAHILTHRLYLTNAAPNGYESAGAWYDSTVELLTEQQVFGANVFGNILHGSNLPAAYIADNLQLPLFMLDRSAMLIGTAFWLRNVVSSEHFAVVDQFGRSNAAKASNARGILPVFGICA